MKIGISDYYYDPDSGLKPTERYRQFAQAGFSYVDFNTARTETPFYTTTEEELKELIGGIRAQIEDAGLRVWQVHGPWCWPPVKDATPEGRVVRAGEMKRSILIASLLGSKYWVVHPIMPFGIRDISEQKEAETWSINKEFMSELLAYAKELDVTICLENMPMRNFSMGRPEHILKFVREMDDDHFKICLDTGHVSYFPDLCVEKEVCDLAGQIRVLHVHDNGGEKDEHLYPGRGVIDWQGFAKALKQIGFDGVLSLETAPADGLLAQEYTRELSVLFDIAQGIAALTE